MTLSYRTFRFILLVSTLLSGTDAIATADKQTLGEKRLRREALRREETRTSTFGNAEEFQKKLDAVRQKAEQETTASLEATSRKAAEEMAERLKMPESLQNDMQALRAKRVKLQQAKVEKARPAQAEAAPAIKLGNRQQEALWNCNLPVCRLRSDNAPRLFVDEMSDGAGHRMKNIFDGIAVAYANKMNFGGVLRSNGQKFDSDKHITEHNVDFVNVVNAVFGGDYSQQFWPGLMQMEHVNKRFEIKEKLEADRTAFLDSSNIYLGAPSGSILSPMSKYYTPEVRAALGKGLLALPARHFVPGRATVAIHDRRGDLGSNAWRHQDPSYYYSLVERIRKELPDADVHVFSSIKSSNNWKASDFDGYRQRGITVHLDEDDLVDTWAHLSKANVFIMAKSAFSYIPAVVNQNCVIAPGYGDEEFPITPGLGNWMEGAHEDRPSFNSELKECLSRAKR